MTRRRPWEVGVECKFLSCVWLFATPWTIQSMEFSRPEYWSIYPFPSPGDFPTQVMNPSLLHCRLILYQMSHKRSPRILQWVIYPFSSGSSQCRNQTRVSSIAGRFFTNWAMREAWEAGECLSKGNLGKIISGTYICVLWLCVHYLGGASVSSSPVTWLATQNRCKGSSFMKQLS